MDEKAFSVAKWHSLYSYCSGGPVPLRREQGSHKKKRAATYVVALLTYIPYII